MTKEKLKSRLQAALICAAIVAIGFQLFTSSNRSRYSTSAPGTVTATSAALAQNGCTATVKVAVLNQRNGPSEIDSVVGTARRGDEFIVTDSSASWVEVSAGSVQAWMYAPYMSFSGDCTVSTTAVVQSASNIAATPQSTMQAANNIVVANSTTSLSTVFTPEVQYWQPEITQWATEYQIDANLIATVIQIESCGDPTIHSSAGAQGLFQVMPFHFSANENMLDVQTNARRGLAYLQGALKLAQGNVGLALAGYNGGYGVIAGSWAAETQRYYYWGSNIYSEANSGVAASPTLQQWLAAGGAKLCTSASASLATLA